MYDVCIIGAGIVGCTVARELSKYDIKICLLEKHEDVSCGTTKANSGIIHGGYNSKHGTLKGKLVVKGNEMYEELDKELNFGFERIGSLVVGFDDEDKESLKNIQENGLKNGVETELLELEKIKELEPYISEDVKYALYCKETGIVSPYEVAIAFAENAVENGVELKLNSEVKSIEKQDNGFKIKVNTETITTKFIVNAAGLFSDNIATMVGIDDFKIKPRRGEYALLDKDQGYLSNKVIFQTPKNGTKGVLVTRTLHGNLLVGPSAEFIEDKDCLDTTYEVLSKTIETAKKSIPGFDTKKIITSFSGIRATTKDYDFIIEESKVKGFINVAGIDSPGLTSAPAIAEKVRDILLNAGMKSDKNNNFNPYRKPYTHLDKMDNEQIQKLINKDDKYGKIVCRCESITEGQIIEVLNGPIPVTSADGVKRRIRAGMGRCQGGFCLPRVMEIISRELNIPYKEINKNDEDSYILTGRTKKSLEE